MRNRPKKRTPAEIEHQLAQNQENPHSGAVVPDLQPSTTTINNSTISKHGIFDLRDGVTVTEISDRLIEEAKTTELTKEQQVIYENELEKLEHLKDFDTWNERAVDAAEQGDPNRYCIKGKMLEGDSQIHELYGHDTQQPFAEITYSPEHHITNIKFMDIGGNELTANAELYEQAQLLYAWGDRIHAKDPNEEEAIQQQLCNSQENIRKHLEQKKLNFLRAMAESTDSFEPSKLAYLLTKLRDPKTYNNHALNHDMLAKLAKTKTWPHVPSLLKSLLGRTSSRIGELFGFIILAIFKACLSFGIQPVLNLDIYRYLDLPLIRNSEHNQNLLLSAWQKVLGQKFNEDGELVFATKDNFAKLTQEEKSLLIRAHRAYLGSLEDPERKQIRKQGKPHLKKGADEILDAIDNLLPTATQRKTQDDVFTKRYTKAKAKIQQVNSKTSQSKIHKALLKEYKNNQLETDRIMRDMYHKIDEVLVLPSDTEQKKAIKTSAMNAQTEALELVNKAAQKSIVKKLLHQHGITKVDAETLLTQPTVKSNQSLATILKDYNYTNLTNDELGEIDQAVLTAYIHHFKSLEDSTSMTKLAEYVQSGNGFTEGPSTNAKVDHIINELIDPASTTLPQLQRFKTKQDRQAALDNMYISITDFENDTKIVPFKNALTMIIESDNSYYNETLADIFEQANDQLAYGPTNKLAYLKAEQATLKHKFQEANNKLTQATAELETNENSEETQDADAPEQAASNTEALKEKIAELKEAIAKNDSFILELPRKIHDSFFGHDGRGDKPYTLASLPADFQTAEMQNLIDYLNIQGNGHKSFLRLKIESPITNQMATVESVLNEMIANSETNISIDSLTKVFNNAIKAATTRNQANKAKAYSNIVANTKERFANAREYAQSITFGFNHQTHNMEAQTNKYIKDLDKHTELVQEIDTKVVDKAKVNYNTRSASDKLAGINTFDELKKNKLASIIAQAKAMNNSEFTAAYANQEDAKAAIKKHLGQYFDAEADASTEASPENLNMIRELLTALGINSLENEPIAEAFKNNGDIQTEDPDSDSDSDSDDNSISTATTQGNESTSEFNDSVGVRTRSNSEVSNAAPDDSPVSTDVTDAAVNALANPEPTSPLAEINRDKELTLATDFATLSPALQQKALDLFNHNFNENEEIESSDQEKFDFMQSVVKFMLEAQTKATSASEIKKQTVKQSKDISLINKMIVQTFYLPENDQLRNFDFNSAQINAMAKEIQNAHNNTSIDSLTLDELKQVIQEQSQDLTIQAQLYALDPLIEAIDYLNQKQEKHEDMINRNTYFKLGTSHMKDAMRQRESYNILKKYVKAGQKDKITDQDIAKFLYGHDFTSLTKDGKRHVGALKISIHNDLDVRQFIQAVVLEVKKEDKQYLKPNVYFKDPRRNNDQQAADAAIRTRKPTLEEAQRKRDLQKHGHKMDPRNKMSGNKRELDSQQVEEMLKRIRSN